MSAERRQNNYAATGQGYKGQNMLGHYAQPGQGHASAQYLPRGLPMSPHMGDSNMQGLANNMGAMNLHTYGSSGTSKSGGSMMSATSSEYNGHPMAQSQGLWVPNQHVLGSMYQVMPGAGQQQSAIPHSPNVYNPAGAYVPQAAYQYGQAMVENSPIATGWTSRVSSGDMPPLMTPRRDSISSNENDIPGTPYTNSGVYQRYGGSATIMDRSPNGVYTNSATPSPSQLTHPYGLVVPLQKQQSMQPTLPPHLLAILQQEPPIPRAIPAPSSPPKPLDRSLENKTGETNVYIRGLLPETTDKMLEEWGLRFGDIASHKSIIDLKTNLCKGFGFIKYHNFEDAENCIRGFHYLGYEVSFARESFYSKLKKFSDEGNTNLYVSNIPKNMNEHELSAIFAPHKVCSSRILRDPAGMGRGVGFARFDTRDICEEIIRKFNNTPVAKPGGEEHLIQIRYSDTQEQKMLKQQTAAGRVFRAAEYEVGVAQARAMNTPDRYLTVSPDQQGAANEFEMYMQHSANTGHYLPQQTNRYRAHQWAPAIPSTLGMSRPTMHMMQSPMSEGGIKLDQDGSANHAVEAKTNPATPVKADEASVSPNRAGACEE
ncbi:hypothetical protein P154DRAFT_449807 [Amniculicola lignicola CBS 123094]|uniref:RRM domain-containing protein n=1 Tax=Amniculicola lignicola CBS 123094 TaxID=1392246 RepID=A0A6A5VY50_9PLEO|nr:hypothetical protein P154DRAFT_449807 [Amniculicola lignicola CBS 123094]